MNIIALVIFITLTIISFIHLRWANGSTWPAKNEYNLVKTVIGEPDMRQMPSKKSILIIAILLFLSGIIALWGGNIISLPLPLWIREFGLFILAFIFATRGLSTYLIAKQLGKRTMPFKALDKALYAPISLIIAIGYIILLIKL